MQVGGSIMRGVKCACHMNTYGLSYITKPCRRLYFHIVVQYMYTGHGKMEDILIILEMLPSVDMVNQLGEMYNMLKQLQESDDDVEELLPVLVFFDSLQAIYNTLVNLFKDWLALKKPIDLIIKELFPAQRQLYTEVWPHLAQDAFQFWHMTGETPQSLLPLVNGLPDPKFKPWIATKRDCALMTLIYLRQYPTFQSLASLFCLDTRTCHRIIERTIAQLHGLLENEVRWHNPAGWRAMAGRFLDFPSAVGQIDGTIIRINIPTGKNQ